MRSFRCSILPRRTSGWVIAIGLVLYLAGQASWIALHFPIWPAEFEIGRAVGGQLLDILISLDNSPFSGVLTFIEKAAPTCISVGLLLSIPTLLITGIRTLRRKKGLSL
jgi:hypothetical protein